MPLRARPGVSAATVVVVVAGVASVVVVTGMLLRAVARERERSERADTDGRTARTELETARHRLREAEDRIRRLEDERARRERVVEGETAALRRELADALAERDRLADRHRASAAERDRAIEDLLALRRETEALRGDLARAARRAGDAEAVAAERGRRMEEIRRRLDEVRARAASLLGPLLDDLRGADGARRVRAHEALCAYAGRTLPFRHDGTDAERAVDAETVARALAAGE